MAKIYALKPSKEPGKSFVYSDVGYIVLGELVRVVDGRGLDRFAREEIFQPAGMAETLYRPGPELQARCAPTQMREGHWMLGEVHDPRAYALGGTAGHAGVFSTARDLSRFCRMILAGGIIDGKRVLAEETVREMTRPRSLPDGTAWRTYGFDVDTAYSSCRGERFDPRKTFGHTGFTGTMFWLDPEHDCYFILLTNSVHPDGRGKTIQLRKAVATDVGEALLGPSPR
jgi:CubicO group peptidase (beta-lactamase class C family)